MGEQRVRIVAGRWRGRTLRAPKGTDTRPTSDRVREALFSTLASILGADLGAPVVLDAFAGSGALGLEALSRGAIRAVFVERDRAARDALTANVAALGVTDTTLVSGADVFAAAACGAVSGGPFGLLFADPPYRIDSARTARLLTDLAQAGAVERGAVVVWEHATGASVPWPEGFEERTTRRYGSTQVSIAAYRGGDR